MFNNPASCVASESDGGMGFADVVEALLVLLEPAADPAASTVELSCVAEEPALIPLLCSDWLIAPKNDCKLVVRLLLIFESCLCFFFESDAALLAELPSESEDDVLSVEFFEESDDGGVFPSNASRIACSSSWSRVDEDESLPLDAPWLPDAAPRLRYRHLTRCSRQGSWRFVERRHRPATAPGS